MTGEDEHAFNADEIFEEAKRDAPTTKKAKAKPNGKDHAAHGPLIQSSSQFVADFTPPDYLIDGVLQRRFFYSLTGPTGSGKTSITLFFAASVALERFIGGMEVAPG